MMTGGGAGRWGRTIRQHSQTQRRDSFKPRHIHTRVHIGTVVVVAGVDGHWWVRVFQFSEIFRNHPYGSAVIGLGSETGCRLEDALENNYKYSFYWLFLLFSDPRFICFSLKIHETRGVIVRRIVSRRRSFAHVSHSGESDVGVAR